MRTQELEKILMEQKVEDKFVAVYDWPRAVIDDFEADSKIVEAETI